MLRDSYFPHKSYDFFAMAENLAQLLHCLTESVAGKLWPVIRHQKPKGSPMFAHGNCPLILKPDHDARETIPLSKDRFYKHRTKCPARRGRNA
jgi:hypothetical protein